MERLERMQARPRRFSQRMWDPRWACVFLLAAMSAGSSIAQRATSAPVTRSAAAITVNANLVVLDVVVTDARGDIVPGLKKGDFTILQDDKPQAIHNFDSWTDWPHVPREPAKDRFGHTDWGSTPLTIFVLDDLNTPFDEKAYSAYELEQYLKAQPAVLREPAMLAIVNDSGLHSLASYTRVRDALIEAVEKRPPSLPGRLTRGANLELLAESFAVVRQIALAAEGLDTHKNLVWIGRGFPSLDPSALDDSSNAQLKTAIEDTVTLLTKARITIYKVDPITTDALTQTSDLNSMMAAGGDLGGAAGPPVEAPLAENFNFNNFAMATGGHYYYGRNDLDKFIDNSLGRGSEFYTLTYVPPAAVTAEEYHTIRVVMRDSSLQASTRQGYYLSDHPPPPPTLKDMGFDLQLAATGSMDFSGVNAQVTNFKGSGSSGVATVAFEVEDRTLTWTDRRGGGEAAKMTVLLVSMDAGHKIQYSSAVDLDLAAASPAVVAHDVLADKCEIKVNGKTRFVRLLVRDSSGRIGTADVDRRLLAETLPGIGSHRGR